MFCVHDSYEGTECQLFFIIVREKNFEGFLIAILGLIVTKYLDPEIHYCCMVSYTRFLNIFIPFTFVYSRFLVM